MRKCRLKYLEHVLHADKLATAKAQNSSKAVGSDGTKTYFLRLVYIERCSSVQTAKTEKICEKTHTPHTHMSKLSVRVNRHLHSAVDMTRLTHVRAPLTADKGYSHL